ncbi:hypothetical protein LOK49_LG12G01378 [Camellia lanceoleosa]|uniref:Uncharacterized protein n=1 Tax=Camellia lanceoleosa TaxID=1840588 RepID=A0ACC0FWH3_9ERIC|nr:hypothetical protein LOK49_LG12G01378 [Camellia lanceoleosa]
MCGLSAILTLENSDTPSSALLPFPNSLLFSLSLSGFLGCPPDLQVVLGTLSCAFRIRVLLLGIHVPLEASDQFEDCFSCKVPDLL